jgi:predicted acylesterase/phospholipase RssA
MSVDECEEAYLRLSDRIFNPRRSSLNALGRAKDLWQVEGRFDAEELKTAILDILKEQGKSPDDLLQDSDFSCRVYAISDARNDRPSKLTINSFVCAVLTSNSRACLLRSYENPELAELLYDTCKIWEACRATSAATTFFAPIAIGAYGQTFADGAVAYNNPIQLVYREAETLWPGAVNDATLISIGTGSAPSPALEGNIVSVVQALKNIVVQTETTADDFFSDHGHMANNDQLFRFNVYHGLAEIGLEEYRERRKVADATHSYLATGETRQRWKKCVQKILLEARGSSGE